ncbi:MAG: glycosyltransferase family 39 protein [Armatimonadetes bacterium]|nr:glycosyltransferase family 39 protein [Armatimonadota bacterium]
MSVAALAVTLLLLHRLAALLLPPDRIGMAVWLIAVHPTVVYVASMANNEAMAMAFSVACVWAAAMAVKATEDGSGQRRRWVVLAVLLGGLGLLTKLTAIAGVTAAAWIIGRDRSSRASLLQGFGVLIGAIWTWLPWGLFMHHLHGSLVPSPVQRPTFGGLEALILYPLDVMIAVGMAVPEFAIGMVCPYWLIRPLDIPHYPVWIGGWLLTIGVIYTAVQRPPLRFAGVAFGSLAALVVSQVLFRD